MEPDSFCIPWVGSALRHIRADPNRDVLDFRLVGSQRGNRWNEPPNPTLYMAGDPGVLVAEWGRHLGNYSEIVTIKRDVYRLHLALRAVLDLRDTQVIESLALKHSPDWYVDTTLTRLVARRIRTTTRAQAMLVPSIAFLDDLTRWNLVVFLEKVPGDQQTWITRVDRIGPLSWQPGIE